MILMDILSWKKVLTNSKCQLDRIYDIQYSRFVHYKPGVYFMSQTTAVNWVALENTDPFNNELL